MYRASCILAGLMLALTAVTASADQRQERIQINAESGDYDMRTGLQTLVGNVRIVQGDLRVEADEGRAYRSDGELERVELFGSPTTWRMVMEDGSVTTGRSEQLNYDLQTGQITMIGDARIEDAQGTFSGASLSYNLGSERIEGTGGVELVLEPGQRREADPPEPEPEPEDAPEDEDDGTDEPPSADPDD
ncbi:MAG: lipopolysaccharide transport periplasmic protein LptA [Wenzhouxiangella sp.]|nr:MAG: lipopolysaccharide transport periplasmic protein LptA [Wenzhouxiangella sp.]